MSRPLRLGGLFEGYGGLTQGVQAVLGGELAWYSEIDKGALKILGHRHPCVDNIGDITQVNWDNVPQVDVITGGFPCQDVSHAGKRAGLKPDTRSGLWSQMAYAIEQMRPGLVLIENVRGLLSAEAHSDLEPCPWCLGDGSASHLRALGAVLGDLADIGYDARWYGLRAADVGAPHGRFRVFVVAYPGGEHGKQWRLTASRQTQGRRTLGEPARRSGVGTLLPTPQAHDSRGRAGEGFNEGGSLVNALLPTPQAHDAKQGAGETAEQRSAPGRFPNPALADAPHFAWGDYADAIHRWESLTRAAPAPTQLSQKGTPQLSAAFSEWMMGLPEGWVTDVPGITRNEALKALGNGVVPQQAASALAYLLNVGEVAA